MMDTGALIMMVVTLLLIWGGLVAALLHLRGHPDEPEAYDIDGDGRPDSPPST
ncbi:methionine/alanine import family NSS transporter small subunit [Ruania suaedae]|uniref:methionine/alanine import family NSS transporter small subunit n=1 Tax=Ruania suaedae TaxID=2897774 RepID=UPI001E289072|nr:methionine/alanine import family NSS transporter small subunit [Ruania suaedae]UFU02154.1 methionine/alanine import family NSS transporter small subunit [Ruania suaedae]